MSYGQDARVGISFQNSFGTANVASLHWLEPISESVSLKKAQLISKGLRGVYDAGAYQEGANTVDGDLSIEAKANALGVLLSAVCGSPTSVTSAALSIHTFKPRTADHSAPSAERPFTYLKWLGDVGSAHEFYDLNGNTLELAVSNGELMTAKLGIVGGQFARIAAVAATYSGSNPIDWSVGSMSLGGVAVTNARQLTISQDNKLQAKHTVDGSKTPDRIKRSDARDISIAGTLIFDDQTHVNTFIAQSTQQMLFSLKGMSLVQSGYYEQVTIDVPSLRFTEMPVVVAGAGEIEVSFKAAATYNVGSGTAIAYTLACGKAGF